MTTATQPTPPLVSVIIPVYNGEAFLEACLYSVLEQSWRNIEVVVVDDGSTDNTPSILARMASIDKRVRVLSIDNRGVSAARNIGLDNANGEFITMVDADDMLHPRAVELFMELITETGTDAVAGRYVNSAAHTFDDVDRLHDVNVYDYRKAISLTLYQRRGMDPSPWCKLFRREILEGVRFREGTRYEDLEIMPRIYERCSRGVASCSDTLYFYRRNDGSFINTVSRTRLDVLDITASIEEHIHHHHPTLLRAARDRRLSANFNMLFICEACGWREDADRCWKEIRRLRLATLFNPHTRLRNKLGALLSLPGRRFLLKVARLSGEIG